MQRLSEHCGDTTVGQGTEVGRLGVPRILGYVRGNKLERYPGWVILSLWALKHRKGNGKEEVQRG